MKIEYYIIKEPFHGNCETYGANGHVAYSKLSLPEYLNDNPTHKAVTESAFKELYTNFWETPFVEITEEQYNEMLECLPPMRWHDVSPIWNVFYCSEAMSGIYHSLYAYNREAKKYFVALKSILLSSKEILMNLEGIAK